jgi:predicted peptidase
MGGNVEYILVPSPNDNHGTVINVYGDSELINWMLNQ